MPVDELVGEIITSVEGSEVFVAVFDERGSVLNFSKNAPESIRKSSTLDELPPELARSIRNFLDGPAIPSKETLRCAREVYDVLLLRLGGLVVVLGSSITRRILLEDYITEQLETLTTYLEYAPIFFVVLDENGRVAYVNSFTLERTGYKLSDVLGQDWFELFIPEHLQANARSAFRDIMEQRVELRSHYENEIRGKDGGSITVLWENRLLKRGDRPVGTLSVGIDVTERKMKDFEEEVLISVLSATTGGNYHEAFQRLNKVLTELCNAKYLSVRYVSDSEVRNFTIIPCEAFQLGFATGALRFERRYPDLNLRIEMELYVPNLPPLASQKCLESVVNVLFSFFERVHYIVQLEEASFRDPLTRLFNRRYFMMTLRSEIQRVKRYGVRASLVMLDLDDLKTINDTFGHDQGDFALRSIARILSESVRNVDVVARYGGDEFVLLLPETSAGAAASVVRRVIEKCSEIGVGQLKISVSAGVTSIKSDDDPEGISAMKRADELLYNAKRAGKGRVVVEEL